MRKEILLLSIILLGMALEASGQEKSHFIIQYKYSPLFPIGFSVGGGLNDNSSLRINFGFASPRTGNEWGKVLPTPEGSTPSPESPTPPTQPTAPSSPTSTYGSSPSQPSQPEMPEMPDTKIDGTAFYAGIAYDYYFKPWLGVYGELDIAWLNSMPSEDSSKANSNEPPPQKENIYFCIPIEVGVNFRVLNVLTFSAGFQYHYKGYSTWTVGAGFTF